MFNRVRQLHHVMDTCLTMFCVMFVITSATQPELRIDVQVLLDRSNLPWTICPRGDYNCPATIYLYRVSFLYL
jgi:hypothetical protein